MTLVTESERLKKIVAEPVGLLSAGAKVVKRGMKKSVGVGQVRADKMGEVRARGRRERAAAAERRYILVDLKLD